ncbi:integrase core domain-containing protein [Deinococcus sp. 6GRE01]|uniref:integrase core domain-containing protein n=1 Tax=Deinococcus sp. 6GRE01 TaxID=2745873 RepID=UPI00351D9ECC
MGTHFIEPGKPWLSGFTESFHSRLREAYLNLEVLCAALWFAPQNLDSVELRPRLPPDSPHRPIQLLGFRPLWSAPQNLDSIE